MKAVRNTAEDVKFIIAMMMCSVFAVVWHWECPQLVKEIKKGWGNYDLEEKNKIE